MKDSGLTRTATALPQYLADCGLLPSTQAKYAEIISSADTSDLLTWIQEKVNSSLPIGTVLPIRAAVKHYLIAEEGYSDEELQELLPRAQGVETQFRESLTPEQLALYHRAVKEIEAEPARTILELLPRTGLKIGEACQLKQAAVVEGEKGAQLRFVNAAGRKREVPLVGSARSILTSYMKANPSDGWLFTGYLNQPIGPHAIRKYTRLIAVRHPDLAGLSPVLLRHTYARMALQHGMELTELQKILGHSSIRTTARYLTGTEPSAKRLT